MTCIDPIVFASIGTLLVISSAIISGFYISNIERTISQVENEITDTSRMLDAAHEAITRSHQHYSPAEIKLLIIQFSGSHMDNSVVLHDIGRGILQGILERCSAATGEGPSQEKFREWEAIAKRSGEGDRAAYSELSDISSSLLAQWAERHKGLALIRDQCLKKSESLKMKTVHSRYISVTLQILGLIMVLLKDVVST